jgi:antitoxin FitA
MACFLLRLIARVTKLSTLTIRKLPEEAHQALKVLTVRAGRSTEAEVRSIIEAAVMPTINFADAMLAIGQSFGGLEVEFTRKRSVIRSASFE